MCRAVTGYVAARPQNLRHRKVSAVAEAAKEYVTVAQALGYIVDELRAIHREVARANDARDAWAAEIYHLLADARKDTE